MTRQFRVVRDLGIVKLAASLDGDSAYYEVRTKSVGVWLRVHVEIADRDVLANLNVGHVGASVNTRPGRVSVKTWCDWSDGREG